jgi:hypothetical protein
VKPTYRHRSIDAIDPEETLRFVERLDSKRVYADTSAPFARKGLFSALEQIFSTGFGPALLRRAKSCEEFERYYTFL